MMSGDGFAISRSDMPEVCQKFPSPPDQREQGIPGARCTPRSSKPVQRRVVAKFGPRLFDVGPGGTTRHVDQSVADDQTGARPDLN